MRHFIGLAFICGSVVACQGGSGLDRDAVTDLPAGNAQGDSFSGDYDLEVYTADCSGRCGPIGIFQLSYCDVGDRTDEDVDVAQVDGALTIDADGFIVTRFEGGIDGDGAYDVGGFGTDLGGDLEATARVTGMVTAEGAFEGVATSHVVGRVDGSRVDCRATYEVSGQREASTGKSDD